MKNDCRVHLLALLALSAASALTKPASAAYVFNVEEVGSSVIIEGSGTINLAGLTYEFSLTAPSFVRPVVAQITIGGSWNSYGGLTGPGNFGAGGLAAPTSSTGDATQISGGRFGSIGVPTNYISGSPLAGTLIYQNASFDSLGFIPGTYIYNFGIGVTADSLTVRIIQPVTVPEPGAALLFGAALLGIGVVRRRTV